MLLLQFGRWHLGVHTAVMQTWGCSWLCVQVLLWVLPHPLWSWQPPSPRLTSHREATAYSNSSLPMAPGAGGCTTACGLPCRQLRHSQWFLIKCMGQKRIKQPNKWPVLKFEGCFFFLNALVMSFPCGFLRYFCISRGCWWAYQTSDSSWYKPRCLYLYCEASMTIYTNGKSGPRNVEEIADSALKCVHLSKSHWSNFSSTCCQELLLTPTYPITC